MSNKSAQKQRAAEAMRLAMKWRRHPGRFTSIESRAIVKFNGGASARESKHQTAGELYQETLKSPEWQKLRTQVIAKHNSHCQRCKLSYPRRELDLHHKHYGSVGHETEHDVILLCKKCHEKEHAEITSVASGFKLYEGPKRGLYRENKNLFVGLV